MVALCEEATRRRTEQLQLTESPAPLSFHYIADRLDVDDPSHGFQIRTDSGMLQGFITVTTFTVWSRYFKWDSLHEKSAMAAARAQNAALRRRKEGCGGSTGDASEHYVTKVDNETPKQIAASLGVESATLVSLNQDSYPDLRPSSKLLQGTTLRVVDPLEKDSITVHVEGEHTSSVQMKTLAADLGITPEDLCALNSRRHRSLGLDRSVLIEPKTWVPSGSRLLTRCRDEEHIVQDQGPDKEPTLRVLDDDGSLAAELQSGPHVGEWTTAEKHGVAWPRIAEIGLLAAVGCGSFLLRAVIEELEHNHHYDFVVMQATHESVTFYERFGFIRVGAVALFDEEDDPGNKTPEAPLAANIPEPLPRPPCSSFAGVYQLKEYAHWAHSDGNRGDPDPAYMMARRLRKLAPWAPTGGREAPPGMLAKRIVRKWPLIQVRDHGRIDNSLRRHPSL